MVSDRSRESSPAAVPGIARWDTFWGTLGNLLLFGLSILAGEWVVHQIAYLIAYGSRFGYVMATTPHRLYMTAAGVALAAATIALLAIAALILSIDSLQRRRLLHLLPSRLHRFVPDPTVRVPFRSVARIAVPIAIGQMAIYVVQENLESYVGVCQGLPGLGVLISPQHAIVVPLHLLLAFCIALILTTLSTWLHASHRAVAAAEDLVRRWYGASRAPAGRVPLATHTPNLRMLAGALSLRSPPLCVCVTSPV